MRTTQEIYAELMRERARLCEMERQGPGTLEQSQKVDELVNEYYRAQQKEAV